MLAAPATSVIIKQAQHNVFRQIQGREKLPTLACEMCISTGRYTVNGQNAQAPSKPKTLLKTGNNMAITDVNITYVVLQINRKKFTL